MPIFRTTKDILKSTGQELIDFNFDRPTAFLPPKDLWDYQRELTIDDVNIWEVLTEESGKRGVYASWDPYAEFYMILTGFSKSKFHPNGKGDVESYYGKGAQNMVLKRAKELGLHIEQKKIWVELEDMWLYEDVKTIKFKPTILVPAV